MASKDITQIENCPFWSTQSMKCRVCKGGLFIPLDDHVEVFCKTPYFPRCLQYNLHPEKHSELIENTHQSNKNRRRFERVEACHRITLVRLVHSGTIVSHFSTFAKTLDLSSGGMRLTTTKPLVNDTVVQFSFEETFPEYIQQGEGQVAWCYKDIDDPGYQAGISFKDDHLIEAMGLYLGLQHREM